MLTLTRIIVRSNISSDPSQRLSVEEILCQISTFIGAGHETTASALTWTFYALARDPGLQARLRRELHSIPLPTSTNPVTTPTSSESPLPFPDDTTIHHILSNTLLDNIIRESLRLYTPVSSTMRVASHDDVIPLSPHNLVRDKNGEWKNGITIRKGDIITVPISEINRCEDLWGERGREFWVGRWECDEGGMVGGKRVKGIVPGLWGGLMTFLNGNPINGLRACIGYRFALNECVVFLSCF